MCERNKMSIVEADFRAQMRVDQIREQSRQSNASSMKCAKLLESALQYQIQKEQEKLDRQIKFLVFIGKVASFMELLAEQIKDEVQQIREPL